MRNETRYVTGYSCDATGCTKRIGGKELEYFNGMELYEKEAIASGWTFWVGRSQRHYCPNHGPHMPTKMRLIAGTLREVHQ